MSKAMTPTNEMIRRKQAVPAESTRSFFTSKLGLARRRKEYLRLAKINVKPNNNVARSSETVKRSSVIVTDPCDELSSAILNYLHLIYLPAAQNRSQNDWVGCFPSLNFVTD